MFAFIVRRLLVSILVMIGATMLVFLLITAGGRNPVNRFAGRNPRPPQNAIDQLTHRMRWDQPVWLRYWSWLKDLVLHGNFGPDISDTVNIGSELSQRFLVTVRLVAAAVIVALLFGVATGVLSAVRQYSIFDYSATFVGFLFLAMPSFWFSVLIKQAAIAVNQGVGHRLFFTEGEATPKSLMTSASAWAVFLDILGHLILPTIALALVTYASWSRYTRGSVLETLNADYIRLARAKGLRWRRVLIRHGLRTALIPLATVTSLDIAGILGGTVITETVFQWNGMGRFLLDSISNVDVYATLAWMLIAGFVVIFFNLLADLLYGVLDPRIRNA
jgi:peptide/nickel transport system permease protein